MRTLVLSLATVLLSSTIVEADIIFESGILGPTGITTEDVFAANPIIPGSNVTEFVFNGARFRIDQPVITRNVGGHFLINPNTDANSEGTFFGAIVRLDHERDFPDSDDLSTPDVVGTTILSYPNPSAEVFGDLTTSLETGWYAIVFGSGLFDSLGAGAALGNNMDVGEPDYIGFQSGSGWGERAPLNGKRFVVTGVIVPEPLSIVPILVAAGSLSMRTIQRNSFI